MPAKKPTQPAETAKQKAPATKRKSQPKISIAQIQTAFERWLKGEQRGDISKDMKLGVPYGRLGKMFEEHMGKSLDELQAMRKGGAKKGSRKPKPAPRKSKKEGATEFTKAKGKGGKEDESDAPAARRKAA